MRNIVKKFILFIKKNAFINSIRRLASFYKDAENIVHLQKLSMVDTDKILVLAPHADDESIGCGGLLLKYSAQCRVICLSDGSLGSKDISSNKISMQRKKEFSDAMNFAKVVSFDFLKAKDGNLINEFDEFANIEFNGFDFVFIPNIFDQHLDHKAVGFHLAKLLKGKQINTKICMYEVWSPLALPNKFLDISDMFIDKRTLIEFYQSQIKNTNYQDRILSLNNYRGMAIGIEYAEVYSLIESSEFLKLIDEI